MQLDFEAEELATRRRYYREALRARQSGSGRDLGLEDRQTERLICFWELDRSKTEVGPHQTHPVSPFSPGLISSSHLGLIRSPMLCGCCS